MPSMRKRKRRRQGRFAPVFKLLFLVAMAAALVLGATVFFQVEHIVVTGNSRYTQQAVINATGIDLGDNLFGVSKTQVSQNIRRRLPYVQAVQVLRRLPNTVSITVTESAAAAQLEGEGGWLINASGKLLEQADSEQVLTVTGLTPLAPAAGTHLVTDEAAAFKRESLLGLLQALEERELLEQAMSIDSPATHGSRWSSPSASGSSCPMGRTICTSCGPWRPRSAPVRNMKPASWT